MRGAASSRQIPLLDFAAKAVNTEPVARAISHFKPNEDSMEELISRVTAAAGIDASQAQNAVGTVLGFLQKEGPGEAVGELLGKIPGAEGLISQAQGNSSGGGLMGAIGGLMGGGAGGLMGLVGQLQGQGLDMSQMQEVGKTLIAYGREVVGEDTMAAITSSIPGMDQLT